MGTSNKDIIQEYTDTDHLLEADKTYHCKIVFKNGTSYFYFDEILFFKCKDEKPLTHGYFCFRTLQSMHIIDNFKVFEMN